MSGIKISSVQKDGSLTDWQAAPQKKQAIVEQPKETAGAQSALQAAQGEESMVDRQMRISWWDQNLLYNARILVAGAGAIGNEVLKNLALLGVGRIFICDMDIISTSNLSRTVLFSKEDTGKYKAKVAAQRVREMSVCPTVEVDYFIGNLVTELGDGVFRQFDLVMGCLDNLEARMSLNKRCNHLQLPYIDGGIWELSMNLFVHHYPYSSCFRCGLTSEAIDREMARTRNSCDHTRKEALEEEKAPTLLISTAIVGALAVQEGIKILHKSDQVKYGVCYHFDGDSNRFETIQIRKKPDEECPCHYCYDRVISVPMTNQVLLKDFLQWFSGYQGGGEYFVDLGEDGFLFTTVGYCPSCGKEVPIYRSNYWLTRKDFYCQECAAKGRFLNVSVSGNKIELMDLYGTDHRVCDRTLAELGIPKAHILKVRDKEDDTRVFYCELTADLPDVLKEITIRENP